jgi:hypothetical protein
LATSPVTAKFTAETDPFAEEEDSNPRSHREGKGYGEPLQASIAVSHLNL